MTNSRASWAGLAAAAIVMCAAFGAVRTDAQSKVPDSARFQGNETITVRTSVGDENLSVASNGCSGSVTGPGTFIGIGDGCWIWSDTRDVPRAMRVRIAPDKIAFSHEGQSYIINDAATVKRARGIFAQMDDILSQQHDLGAQQRALGEKQRELGRQQRGVKVSVPDMSAEFAKVEADAKRLSTQGGTQSELGGLQSELGDLQSRIGDLQSQVGKQQSKFGEQQSVLGDQQSRLGDQQSELGDKSEAMAKDVLVKLQALLMQAIQSGAAQKQ